MWGHEAGKRLASAFHTGACLVAAKAALMGSAWSSFAFGLQVLRHLLWVLPWQVPCGSHADSVQLPFRHLNIRCHGVCPRCDDNPWECAVDQEDKDLSVRLVETDLVTIDEAGNEVSILMFDTYTQIMTSAGHDLVEGSVIIGDPV